MYLLIVLLYSFIADLAIALAEWHVQTTIEPVLKVPGQQPKKLKAHHIACCPDGSMVVADDTHNHQYMVTSNGEYKAALKSTSTSDSFIWRTSIAVTQKYITISISCSRHSNVTSL